MRLVHYYILNLRISGILSYNPFPYRFITLIKPDTLQILDFRNELLKNTTVFSWRTFSIWRHNPFSSSEELFLIISLIFIFYCFFLTFRFLSFWSFLDSIYKSVLQETYLFSRFLSLLCVSCPYHWVFKIINYIIRCHYLDFYFVSYVLNFFKESFLIFRVFVFSQKPGFLVVYLFVFNWHNILASFTMSMN